MLSVQGGRFPSQQKLPMPFWMVSWITDEHQVKAVNVPFSVTLADDGKHFSMTFEDKDTEKLRTMGGECQTDEDTGVIRLDTMDSLDFWMELKRVSR